MFARNLVTLLKHLVSDGKLVLDLEDEITKGALLAHEGRIANETVRARAEAAPGGDA
jgi:hypothetical protein